MPDEAREVLFPKGVPVHIVHPERRVEQPATSVHQPPTRRPPHTIEATAGTEDLTNEQPELQEQARHARKPETGENLLL